MFLKINLQSAQPLYMQLRNGVVLAIGEGELKPGDRLPTVRQLAGELGINPMTVQKAYALLKQEGFLAPTGRATRIAEVLPKNADFKAQLRDQLHLMAAEARLQGMDENAFVELCRAEYAAAGTGGDGI